MPKEDCSFIAWCVVNGLFPSLKVVRLCNWDPSRSADQLSLRSKGILVHFITRKVPQEAQTMLPFPGKCNANDVIKFSPSVPTKICQSHRFTARLKWNLIVSMKLNRLSRHY